MQLTPEFLPVGSIVEYNIGTLKEPEYIPTTLDAVDLQSLVADPEDFNYWHRGIPLTEKILTEWCKWEVLQDGWYGFNINNEPIITWNIYDKCLRFYGKQIEINYLHELQLLFLGFKIVLPIQIK